MTRVIPRRRTIQWGVSGKVHSCRGWEKYTRYDVLRRTSIRDSRLRRKLELHAAPVAVIRHAKSDVMNRVPTSLRHKIALRKVGVDILFVVRPI